MWEVKRIFLKERENMDQKLAKEIMDVKVHNKYPEGLTKQQRYTIKRRASTFVLKDGVLHYICRRRKDKSHLAKVVVSAAEANSIFEEFHCSIIGSHCGVEKTHNAIITRYYWPGMEADIRKWVAQCPNCQAKRASLKEKIQYNPIEVTEPFELVGMDLMRLTVTEGGNQYICVMVDYFTKWAEAYPLKSKSADEVTNCIIDFVYKFGAPQRLLTDQGTEFKNQVNSRLCEALGIQRSFCAPYHPQTNGLVEKLNGTIQKSLGKLAQQHPQKWDHYLQGTMFGLRTKKQLTTKYSPYYLMFGREARYTSQVAIQYQVTTDKVEGLVQKEEVNEGLSSQKSVYEDVLINVKKSQTKTQKRKLEKGVEDNFRVGDVVLKQNIRAKQRKGGKMECDMLGPFKITSIDGKVVHLENANTKMLANMDQLTIFKQTEKRVPQNLAKNFKSPLAPPSPLSPPSPSSPATPQLNASSSPAFISHSPPASCSGESLPTLCKALHDIQEMKGEILLAKLGPYKLYTSDFKRLAPHMELESEIINAYLVWLTRKLENPVCVIDTFEMTAIWNGTSKGMKKLDVTRWETLVGAVCKNNHWTLVAMYPKQGKSVFVDPFGATANQLKQCQDATRAFMRRKNLNISRWACHTVSHPCQQDSTSCGVLVCKIAELLLTGETINFDAHEDGICTLRNQIAVQLLADSDDLTSICKVCGERDPGEREPSEGNVEHWIECTLCQRWFHWVCVAQPNMMEDYFCPACPSMCGSIDVNINKMNDNV